MLLRLHSRWGKRFRRPSPIGRNRAAAGHLIPVFFVVFFVALFLIPVLQEPARPATLSLGANESETFEAKQVLT